MKPADMLEGCDLADGWRVLERITKKPNATGGNFSTGYLVEHADGRQGFLKAMDYTAAFNDPDTPRALQLMTQAYLFERQICEACREKKLKRIAHAIAAGSINPQPGNPTAKVEYLIFERAQGDIRVHLDTMNTLDYVFILRVLHDATVGLKQLHSSGMAHQDLKPSNVLLFASDSDAKLSDLGRAWSKYLASPYDGADFAGDWTYAPIELYYNHRLPDREMGRIAHDLYLLGSLFFFMFTRVHANAFLARYLAAEHQPQNWGQTFEEVLPYLRQAFASAISEAAATIPEGIREEVISIMMQLCEPNPIERGDPSAGMTGRNRYDLQRIISRLNHMSYQLQTKL